jgi:CDP-glycerol glycerophosphotransferase (TagB/SpsB family)
LKEKYERVKKFIFRFLEPIYNIIFSFLKIKTFFIIFSILEIFIPKNWNTIIFAGSYGQKYSDNSRYLFEYCLKNSNFQCYWLTDDKKIYFSLQKIFPSSILYTHSLRSVLIFFISKTVVIDYGRGDVSPYQLFNYKKNVINLWHGMPLKKVGFLDNNEVISGIVPTNRRIDYKEYTFETKNYNFMVCCSELEKEILSASFHVPINSIWTTGYPRNDALELENSKLLKQFPFLTKKVILYAPTWRDNISKTKFFPFPDFNARDLITLLEKNDAYLLLRAHQAECEQLCFDISFDLIKSNRIHFADEQQFPDVNDLLPFVNILITDYSSIFIDYLLLDRPIIFIPYDYEDYKKYRGFTLDYFLYTPGPKVLTQKDFFTTIENYFDDPHRDSKTRKKIRDIFHKYQDSNACERILKEISKILNRKT